MDKYEQYEESTLASLLQQSDEGAYTEIYNRYWSRLYALSYHRLQDRQVAEDIVHEVFTSLWQNRYTTTIHSLYAYLATATKYCILKQFNHNQRYPLASEKLPPELEAVKDHTIDIRFLEKMIQQEITHLPTKCRLVFQYSREAYMSNKEIADRMGISQKAVEKHMTKAIRQLRLSLRSFTSLFFLIPALLFIFCPR